MLFQVGWTGVSTDRLKGLSAHVLEHLINIIVWKEDLQNAKRYTRQIGSRYSLLMAYKFNH